MHSEILTKIANIEDERVEFKKAKLYLGPTGGRT